MTPHREPRTGDLVAAVLHVGDDVVLRCVQGVHEAVLARTQGAVRGVPIVPMVAAAQNAITRGVYGAISLGFRAAEALAATTAEAGLGSRADDSPGGRATRSVLNAYIGDRLRAQKRPSALAMTIQQQGAAVATTADGFAAAFPTPGQDLVVFVHGLGEHDQSWAHARTERGSTYVEDVDSIASTSAIVVRYNTGRRVWDNGAELATLLDQVVTAWPCTVRSITLVGHSMGGLVSRAAVTQAADAGAGWVERVTTLVSLGTPHRGAPMAQAAEAAARGLRVVAETRPFADLIDSRSAGIVDLRRGATSEADWRATEFGRVWATQIAPLTALPGVAHHFVVGLAWSGQPSIVSRWLGDFVVPQPSAAGGEGADRVVPDAHIHHVRAHHMGLLNNAEVAALLRGIVGGPDPVAAPAG